MNKTHISSFLSSKYRARANSSLSSTSTPKSVQYSEPRPNTSVRFNFVTPSPATHYEGTANTSSVAQMSPPKRISPFSAATTTQMESMVIPLSKTDSISLHLTVSVQSNNNGREQNTPKPDGTPTRRETAPKEPIKESMSRDCKSIALQTSFVGLPPPSGDNDRYLNIFESWKTHPEIIDCSICGQFFEILEIVTHYEQHQKELETMIGRKPLLDWQTGGKQQKPLRESLVDEIISLAEEQNIPAVVIDFNKGIELLDRVIEKPNDDTLLSESALSPINILESTESFGRHATVQSMKSQS